MKPHGSSRSFFILSALILVISSSLLAIWALTKTIALRNSLLALGTLVAILILTQHSPIRKQHGKTLNADKPISHYLPLILSLLALAWVVIHYLLFTQEPVLQLLELKSTWLRTLESLLIGTATGLVIQNHPKRAQFLWLGIFCSFGYLLLHYLLAYSQSGQLFMPNYYFSSPFGNKINTVLMGGLFISAICGSAASLIIKGRPQYKWPVYCFWVVGIFIILFAFTNIIDTRNGIGVGLILLTSWALIVGASKLIQYLRSGKLAWKTGLIVLVPALLIAVFVQQHLSINRGWNHFVDDLAIAVKIDEVPNWQDVKKYGYPNTANGEQVYPNNYERAAWATAGIKVLIANPLGYGILEHSLGKVIQKAYPKASIRSSHSAWIDFGLAFGFPGLLLTLAALLSTIVLAFKSESENRYVVMWIATDLLLTFTVAEVSSKHTIEILFFCIALLNTMLLKPKN
jgi:hypothetical protein